ncbi:PD-(D/E)XK nuclease family protein [Jatrophihabitans sp.]|uniref:RecB family exonuclease n=1 Tax=Jatrophihabitans sp. TaxID=1932789 RepID=UPI0030C7501E|nr:RecB family exonuclease [Jatrophihabitans sp.]
MSQLGPSPQRLFSCTPSKLTAFDCPRRYRFSYVDRPPPAKGPAWAHNTVGAAVHVALARWYSTLVPAHRTTEAGEILVEAAWQDEGFRDAEQSARWRERAAGWVRSYLAGVDPRREPIGVERTVGTATATLAISGRVDRIDDRGDELVIVDYKTGRTESSEDEARGSLALALYVLAARRTLRRPVRRVELHHLPSGTVAGYDHTDESLARHLARAESTAADIVVATDTLAAGADPDDVFPPVPSALCSWCDFRAACPEGQAASSPLDSWAGLREN